jgi:hypothetical protein
VTRHYDYDYDYDYDKEYDKDKDYDYDYDYDKEYDKDYEDKRAISMDCLEAQILILEPSVNGRHEPLQRHLAACAGCRRAAEDAGWAAQALEAVAHQVERESPIRPSIELEQRVRRLAHERLARAHPAAGPRNAPPHIPTPGGHSKSEAAAPSLPDRLLDRLLRPVVARPVWALAGAALLGIGLFAVVSGGLRPAAFGSVDFADGPFTVATAGGPRAYASFHEPVALRPGAKLSTGDATRAFFSAGPARVAMAEGSRLTLTDDTGFRLDAGEVWLQVEHDGRGFVVRTPHGDVTVTGTRFGVAVDATGAATNVDVAEGSVVVSASGAEGKVTAGERMTADSGGVSGAMARPDGTALPGWLGDLAKDRQAGDAVHYLPTFTGGRE